MSSSTARSSSRVAASRTVCGHGCGSPSAAASASARVAVVTRARWTEVGAGIDGRAADSAPAGRSSRRRRSGSGRRRRTQRATGHPVASVPRRRCARSTASTTAGTPHASPSAATRCSRSAFCTPRARPPAPHAAPRASAAASTSAARRSTAADRAAARRSIAVRSASSPSPVSAETGVDRHLPEPVLAQEPREVAAHPAHPVGTERVDLVEDDLHDARVARQPAEVLLVPGGVGVLLRVDDPDEEVRERDDAVDLLAVRALDRVEVRQVEQHQRRAVLAGDAMAPGHLEPVEQRVGRRAPDRGGRGRRRRPAPPGGHDVLARERVEQRRLARSRRARQCDDRGFDAEPDPRARPSDHGLGGADGVVARPPAGQLRRVAERCQPPVEPFRRRARPPAQGDAHRSACTAAARRSAEPSGGRTRSSGRR